MLALLAARSLIGRSRLAHGDERWISSMGQWACGEGRGEASTPEASWRSSGSVGPIMGTMGEANEAQCEDLELAAESRAFAEVAETFLHGKWSRAQMGAFAEAAEEPHSFIVGYVML